MIKHSSEASDKPNEMRSKMVFNFLKHWKIDGLVVVPALMSISVNEFCIQNLNYTVVSRITETFYTNITVDLKYENRLPMTLLVM